MDTRPRHTTRVLGAHCLVQPDKVLFQIFMYCIIIYIYVLNIVQYFRFSIRSSVRERYLVASAQRETT